MEGPAADSEVSIYQGTEMEITGPPLAWPSIPAHGVTSLTVITSAFVQFLPQSHKKPPDKEVNFFFLETPLWRVSYFNFSYNS